MKVVFYFNSFSNFLCKTQFMITRHMFSRRYFLRVLSLHKQLSAHTQQNCDAACYGNWICQSRTGLKYNLVEHRDRRHLDSIKNAGLLREERITWTQQPPGILLLSKKLALITSPETYELAFGIILLCLAYLHTELFNDVNDIYVALFIGAYNENQKTNRNLFPNSFFFFRSSFLEKSSG